MYQKSQYLMYSSWDTEWDRIFCYYGPYFALLPTPYLLNDFENQSSERKKKMKKMPADIILLYIHVYHKWISYDIWFQKYKMQQTEIFVILGHFFPFSPLKTWKIKILIFEKNTWRYHFTNLHHKWPSYDALFLRYGVQQTYNFLSFWTIFCPFTPLGTQKIKILKKCKKHLKIFSFYKCVP